MVWSINDKSTKSLGDLMLSNHNHIPRRYAAMTEIIHTKTCSKCQETKPLSEFYKNKTTSDGLQYMCKACVLGYRQYHKKELKIKRDINREDLNEYGRKYYKGNKGKIADNNKEYRKTEVGKNAYSKATHRYQALKLGATIEDFSPIEVFKRDGYICQLCKKKTRLDYKHTHPLFPNLDHIVPLSLGGPHSPANTKCLCRHCNLTKSNTGTGDQLRMFG